MEEVSPDESIQKTQTFVQYIRSRFNLYLEMNQAQTMIFVNKKVDGEKL